MLNTVVCCGIYETIKFVDEKIFLQIKLKDEMLCFSLPLNLYNFLKDVKLVQGKTLIGIKGELKNGSSNHNLCSNIFSVSVKNLTVL